MNRHWIFDLDDTLVECRAHFLAAERGFMHAFRNHPAGITPEAARKVLREENLRRLHAREFHPEAVLRAHKAALDRLFALSPVPPEVREAVLAAGEIPLRAQYRILPGAIDALETLARKDVRLGCLTLGDPDFQMTKLRRAGLAGYFDSVRVVRRRKTPAVFRGLARRIGGSNATMVGDSLTDDMRPALLAGCRAVWIEHAPTERRLDDREVGPDALDLFARLRSVAEVPRILERILARGRGSGTPLSR